MSDNYASIIGDQFNTQSTVEETKWIAQTTAMFVSRNTEQQMLSATVYLKYFSTQYDEKVLDNWIKVYFPMMQENDF